MNVVVKLTSTPTKAFLLLGCLAAGLATQADASEVYIQPTITGYSMYWGTPSGDYGYYKGLGNLEYGMFYSDYYGWTEHGFLKFGLSSLPDTCVILSAELWYFDLGDLSPPLPNVDIRLIRDPDSLSAHDLFSEIENARAVTPEGESRPGWNTWALDSLGLSLLDSCRHTGWISFGVLYHSGNSSSACGYQDSNPPYLHIVYRSSGILETQSVPAAHSLLDIAPNPTRSAFVVASHTAAIEAALTLRDVLGRTIRSFNLNPYGRTRLDLRGLAPGVYMATLEGTGRPVSRKLIITAR